MKRWFLLLLCWLIIPIVHAKTRSIEIDKVLKEATSVRTITVYGYKKDSLMYYGREGSSDTFVARCPGKYFSDRIRMAVVSGGGIRIGELRGSWPSKGTKVLVVLNGDRVVLFANKEEHVYRFWDPNCFIGESGSAFLIPVTQPYLPLEDCKETLDKKHWFCWDGCRITAADITER